MSAPCFVCHWNALAGRLVEYIADRISVMRNGCIEEQGACAEVLARPASEYTRMLLAAVQRLRAGLEPRLVH